MTDTEGTPADPADLARHIAAPAEAIHGIGYFPAELRGFNDNGFRGWWHAYFAYRCAPMGSIGVATAVAAFYNFAPRMIERAIPGVWDIMSPEQVLERHAELRDAAARRIWAEVTDDIVEAGTLAASVAGELDVTGRLLYAGHRDLDMPTEPRARLIFACTLLREFRGDGHIVALREAGVGPVESHVLMAGRGIGNPATIMRIRGWNEDEWAAGVATMHERGWVDADGAIAEDGRSARRAIERRTNELAAAPIERLDSEQAARLVALLSPLAERLIESGEIPGRWPPPNVAV